MELFSLLINMPLDSSGAHQVLGLINHIAATDWLFLAQQVQDAKVLDNIQGAFGNFVQSGQAWAMLFGVVLGYMFRVFTGPS
jgi:hypothetical protein